MNCIASWLAAFALVGLAAGAATADDAKSEKAAEQAKKQAARKSAPAFKLPESIALSEDQKAKLEEIRKEFEPKLADVHAKGDVLTSEQKEIQREFAAEAKKSGMKGKELRDELDAKLKLTDEQKASLASYKEQASALQKTIRERIGEILTAEQRKSFDQQKSAKAPAKNPDGVKKPGAVKTPDGVKKPADGEAVKKPTEPKKEKKPNPDAGSKKDPEKTPGKSPVKDPSKVPEKKPQKVPEKTPVKVPEKTPEKVPEKIPEKVPEKIPEKVPEKVPEKSAEGKSEK